MVKVMVLVRKRSDMGADDSTPPYDAVMEDWFSSMEAMQAGFAGPEGQAVAADFPTFADPGQLRILVVQEVEMPLTAMAPGSTR